MKKYTVILLTILLISSLAALEYVPKQMIVKTKNVVEISNKTFNISELDDFLRTKGVKRITPILNKRDNKYYLVDLEKEIDWEKNDFSNLKSIDYVQPNYLNEMHVTPNDPYYIFQHFDPTRIPEAWNYTTGNPELLLAIVDSGIHFEHPDLQQNIYVNEGEIPAQIYNEIDNENIRSEDLVNYLEENQYDLNNDGVINQLDIFAENSPFSDGIDSDNNGYIDDILGWDFVHAPGLASIATGDYEEQDNFADDDNNHGTHIAGILSADTNNGTGISGINWNSKLLIVRSGFNTPSGGYLQDDDAAAGVIYAADMGARVISLSWGDLNYSPIIADACNYAYNKGSIIVVSSGNTNEPGIMYPAKMNNTIAVGSIDEYSELASFTSYGYEMDVVAPGVNILSSFDITENLLYNEQSGTSMSSPIVAGIISLLLSVQPELTFEEIRSRLHNSAIDLGDTGFDPKYGSGLIDAYSLLMQTNYPQIQITTPAENAGFATTFDIIGTVNSPNFLKYSVMYASQNMPSSHDWKNVSYPHDNNPEYYFEPIENDVVATFIVDDTVLDGDYMIRTDLISQNYEHYIYINNFSIDKTPPVLNDSLTSIMKRYRAENTVYYLQAVYDDKVSLVVECDNGLNVYSAASNVLDSIQVIELPPEMPDDYYEITLKSTNNSNLQSTDTLANEIEFEYSSIDVNKFKQKTIGNELIVIDKYYDINGNGKYEFFAKEKFGDSDTLRMFEISPNKLDTIYTFDFDFYPNDMGNTDEYGIEISGLMASNVVVYESTDPGQNPYPNQSIFSHNNTYYSAFLEQPNFNYDLALKANFYGGSIRKYYLLTRFGNTFSVGDSLINTSTTFTESNEFVSDIKTGILDGNIYPDILTADQDGDVMIFEPPADSIVWMTRLPIPNAELLAIGDFVGNNDGLDDFCVGGYNIDPTNPAKSFSYIEFFRNNGYTHQYQSIGYLSFAEVNSNNSITTVDVNLDCDEEIILSLPPNLYIVDYVDGKFEPIWKGEADSEFDNSVLAIPENLNQGVKIITNMKSNDNYVSSVITASEVTNNIATPELFEAVPLSENSVNLKWKQSNDIDYYKIYRKNTDNIITLLDSTYQNTYIDSTLSMGDTVYYQITAFDLDLEPYESLPTAWKQIVTDSPPKLVSIKMLSLNSLQLITNKRLFNEASNLGIYFVNNEIGHPVSVNMIHDNKGILMFFRHEFTDPEISDDIDSYDLIIKGLKNEHGVLFHDENYPGNIIPITYKDDIISPKIESIEIINRQRMELFFSESVIQESAENIDNYNLIPPTVDAENEIVGINYNQSNMSALIDFSHKAHKTNQFYFLEIENIVDLAGNEVSNYGNQCTFSMNPINKLSDMTLGPNPFNRKKHEEIKFYFPLNEEVNLKIYNLTGEMVFSADIEPLTELINYYSWKAENNDGQKISSGIYFYIVNMSGNITRGKIAIIN